MSEPTPPPIPGPVAMLTFAPMVDSECTRLILSHYRIPFKERDHIFGWSSLLTLFHLGYGRIPLVYGKGIRATGPRRLVDKLDPRAGDRRLLPLDPPLRAEVEKSWALYNGSLGADVAVFAYHHLLPERSAMIEVFAGAVGPTERKWAAPTYGFVSGLLKLLLRLSPQRAADARSRILRTLDVADGAAADGRACLHGPSITIADCGLASAAAPLLVPPRYAANVPAVDALPEAYRTLVEDCRRRPFAQLVGKILGRIG